MPMTTTNVWQAKSGQGWEALDDQSCFENNRDAIDESGAVGFVKF